MEDEGLDPADRPRTLQLVLIRHGGIRVRPTVPTRVEVFRPRTGMVEAWEVIAWLPLTSEFVAWRRDVNHDGRLKAKEFAADEEGCLEGMPVELADFWADEPAVGEQETLARDTPATPSDDGAFLRALDLGLTESNSFDLAKYGSKPPRSG